MYIYICTKGSPLCGCSPVHLPTQARTLVGLGVPLQGGFPSLIFWVLLPACSSTPPKSSRAHPRSFSARTRPWITPKQDEAHGQGRLCPRLGPKRTQPQLGRGQNVEKRGDHRNESVAGWKASSVGAYLLGESCLG